MATLGRSPLGISEKNGAMREKFTPGDEMGAVHFSPFIAPALEEIAKAHPGVIEDLEDGEQNQAVII